MPIADLSFIGDIEVCRRVLEPSAVDLFLGKQPMKLLVAANILGLLFAAEGGASIFGPVAELAATVVLSGLLVYQITVANPRKDKTLVETHKAYIKATEVADRTRHEDSEKLNATLSKMQLHCQATVEQLNRGGG